MRIRRSLQAFRILFPRWDFFDQLGYQFKLEYCILNAHQIENQEPQTPWTLVNPKLEAVIWQNLFCNYKNNLSMYINSQIEIFASQLENLESKDFQSSLLKLNLIVASHILDTEPFKSYQAQPDRLMIFRVLANKTNSQDHFEIYKSQKVSISAFLLEYADAHLSE